MDIQKPIPPGLTDVLLAHELRDELASQALAIGATCLYVKGRVGDDLVLEFDGAPNDAALDAALAAFPTTPEPVDGTVNVVSGGNYQLGKPIVVRPGESVALDMHIHVALGNAANFVPAQFDYYACVYRRTAGDVLATDPTGIRDGNVPSLAIKITCDETRAWIYVTLRTPGQLTIIGGDIEVTSRGMVPE